MIKLPMELGSNAGMFMAALESKYEMAGGVVIAVLKETVQRYIPKMGANGEPLRNPEGKPLAGAAKAAFLKKCQADNPAPAASGCAEKAVGKNGKPLAGAAKTAFMKKCEADK